MFQIRYAEPVHATPSTGVEVYFIGLMGANYWLHIHNHSCLHEVTVYHLKSSEICHECPCAFVLLQIPLFQLHPWS